MRLKFSLISTINFRDMKNAKIFYLKQYYRRKTGYSNDFEKVTKFSTNYVNVTECQQLVVAA